jgi:hypothetical protein
MQGNLGRREYADCTNGPLPLKNLAIPIYYRKLLDEERKQLKTVLNESLHSY